MPAVKSALKNMPGTLSNLLSHSSVHSPLGEHCTGLLLSKEEAEPEELRGPTEETERLNTNTHRQPSFILIHRKAV